MNVRALIPLVAGLMIGGLALKLGLDFVQRAKGAQEAKTQVWVAQRDIPRWMEIEESMVRAVAFPAASIPPGAFVAKEKLLGRVLRMVAPTGLPILESMLLPPGTKPGMVVPKGFRAVAVKIDEGSGVDYHLQPGCRVDVIGYFQSRTNSGKTRLIARTIIEDVEVAAVGARLSPENPAEQEKSGKGNTRQKKVRAVTLFVKPQQAPYLHMAEQKGKIKLALRGRNDDTGSGESNGVTFDALLGEARPQDQSPGMLDRLAKLFARPAPVAQAAPARREPSPAPQPTLTWVMRVWNGDEMQVWGWQALDSIEAIDLTATARGEQQKQQGPPPALRSADAVHDSNHANEASRSAPRADDVAESKDSEPEELNE